METSEQKPADVVRAESAQRIAMTTRAGDALSAEEQADVAANLSLGQMIQAKLREKSPPADPADV